MNATRTTYLAARRANNEQRVVCIGGGTGMPLVLRTLKNHPVHLSAIVAMSDDGGSTGILRDEYGVAATGDVRRALVALSEPEGILKELFNYRFGAGGLEGHSFGNLFLTTLEKITGSFAQAVEEAGKILKIKGEVIPVTLDNTRLFAELENGQVIKGETNIDIPKHDGSLRIKKIWLDPEARMNPKAGEAILAADLVIIGPGDIYSSLIPNLLVNGMSEAIKRSKATKLYICNLMTKRGETHDFKAEDFVSEIEKYTPLDFALFNTKKPSEEILKKYKKAKSEFVEPPAFSPKVILADLLAEDGFIRHDSGKKLADVILSLRS